MTMVSQNNWPKFVEILIPERMYLKDIPPRQFLILFILVDAVNAPAKKVRRAPVKKQASTVLG